MVSGFNHLDIGEIKYTNNVETKIDDKFTPILNQMSVNKKPLILKTKLNGEVSINGNFVLNYSFDGTSHSFYTGSPILVSLLSKETYWVVVIKLS